jgi:ABC-type multidrug transport system fused ATPase/permease subunit
MNTIFIKIIKWKERVEIVNISIFTIAMLLLLTFIGTVTELIGLTLFLPIFQYLRLDGDIASLINESSLWNYVINGLQYLGLEVSLGILLVSSFLMFSIKQIVGYIKTLYEKSIDLRTIKFLRDNLFSRYLYVDTNYQEKNTIGEFISTVVVETNRSAKGIMMPVSLLGHIIILLGYLVILFLLSWEMTVIAIILSIITVRMVSHWFHQSKIVGRGITRYNAELTSFMTLRVKHSRLIRLSNMEDSEIRDFKDLTKNQRNYFYESAVLMAKNKSVIEPIIIGLSLFFIYLSYTFFYMSIEMIGLYLIVIFRLMPLLKATIGLYQGLESVEGSVESVLNKYHELDEFKEIDKGKYEISNVLNGIEIKDISFKYKGLNRNTLSSINISINPGEMLAIVGPSGSGKSTLMDLIPRLYHPTSGVIKLNNIPIENYKLKSLRNMVSYLSQSPQIFNGTIEDHIRYGRNNATISEVYDAAILSGADSFIRDLQDGYNTHLTDDALNISGGQRQRLDLARAIIGESKILILDEPSSSLDAESEIKFRDALNRIRLNTNLIIIMITHRLLNAYTADHIIVLNNGRIESEGTHSELINTKGWYSDVWNGE